MKKPEIDENKILSTYQKWYWKNPYHARALQNAKYKRYPDKIKASIKRWQQQNQERWKILSNFNSRIYYWRVVKNNPTKVMLLEAAKKTALQKLKNQ